MVKFRIECKNGSKYFNENEKEKADRYFQSRVILQLPAEYWVMNISAFATTQTLLKKTIEF